MPIPGFIIALLTFPGVIVHEFAHQVFCHLTGTRVIKVCYFRFGNPAGYVLHERPSSTWHHILIGIGPLFVNSLIGFWLGTMAPPIEDYAKWDLPGAAILWLAVSIGMHSFPSTGDAKAIWSSLWQRGTPFLARVLGVPLVGLIYLGAFGSFFWLDFLYGVAIAVVLPRYLRAG